MPTGGLGNDGAYHLDNVFDETWTTEQVGVLPVVCLCNTQVNLRSAALPVLRVCLLLASCLSDV